MSGIAALSVYAGLLALLAIGIFVRPPTAFTAVSCIFGLKQWGQATNGWLAAHPPATNLAIGVLVLCAILTAMARGRCVFCRIPAITWLILALLLYSLVTLAWTPRADLAQQAWHQAYPYLLTFIVLVPLVLHEPEDFRIALSWLVIVGGLLVTILLVFAPWGDRGLSLGTTSLEEETNPLALAGLGGSVAAAAMLLRARWGGILSLALRLAVVAVGLILIVKSESRGQLIAAVGAMLLMLPFGVKIGSLRGIVLALVGCVAVAAALQFGFAKMVSRDQTDRWSEATQSADAAVRLTMVEKLLNAWSEGGAGTILLGLGNSASYDPNLNGIYPHNVPMEVLGEEGLVGFALYMTLFISALTALLRAIIASSDQPENRQIVAAMGGGFLFFAMLTFKQGNMLGSVEFFMYAILLTRLSYALRQMRTASLEPAPTPAVGLPMPLYPNLMR
ncbi:MAG TPA: O-antigen ligase family protein [Steroidobacteraceae bacterium]